MQAWLVSWIRTPAWPVACTRLHSARLVRYVDLCASASILCAASCFSKYSCLIVNRWWWCRGMKWLSQCFGGLRWTGGCMRLYIAPLTHVVPHSVLIILVLCWRTSLWIYLSKSKQLVWICVCLGGPACGFLSAFLSRTNLYGFVFAFLSWTNLWKHCQGICLGFDNFLLCVGFLYPCYS